MSLKSLKKPNLKDKVSAREAIRKSMLEAQDTAIIEEIKPVVEAEVPIIEEETKEEIKDTEEQKVETKKEEEKYE